MEPENTARDREPDDAHFLTRSRIEIAAILSRIREQELPLAAFLENGELIMLTRLRCVDPGENVIVVDYGLSRPANQLLLRQKAVVLHCDSGRRHIQFPSIAPRETMHDGQPAVRMNFPESLLQHLQRRHPRFRIPLEWRMKCRVECPGVLSFDMDVLDVSRGGLGIVAHGTGIRLEPGTVLRGCRIHHPMHEPVEMDLEIRHSEPVRRPDGGTQIRTGCRFVGPADRIAALAGIFNINLDAPPQ